MSKFLFLPLILLVSCVSEAPQTGDEGIRDIKRYEEMQVDPGSDEHNRLKAICTALRSKEDLLSILVTTDETYTFSYSQKNCSEKSVPSPKLIETTIERLSGNYLFVSKKGETFPFTDVETFSSGLMAEICQNLDRLTNPMTTNSGAIWFTTKTAKDRCEAGSGEMCIHIQRGAAVDSVNYKIHTNDWIKFKLVNEKTGFFIERRQNSSANCPENKILERTAILK